MPSNSPPTASSDDSVSDAVCEPIRKRGNAKLVLLLLLLSGGALTLIAVGDELTLTRLAERESAFRSLHANHPEIVWLAALLAYVIMAGLSLPGATALTLLISWLFGFWQGMLVVSFGSTAGAVVAFLLSRYLFRDSIDRRFGDRLQTFNDALQREGPFYLFTLRLIPAVPFFVINAVMGLTPLKTRTFWWVSQVGMLPGTAVYVYAGSRVPRLQTLADKGINAVFTPTQMSQLLAAFVLLGLFPLCVRFVMKRLAPRPATEIDPTATSSETL